MINVIDRQIVIPDDEKPIGLSGDNKIETRIFVISDLSLQDFNFKLNIRNKNNDIDIIDLIKSIENDEIKLVWEITERNVSVNGYLYVQLRAFDNTELKWHSELEYFEVGESININDYFSSPLPSEFEQMEKRITDIQTNLVGDTNAATERANAISEDLEQKVLEDYYRGETGYGITDVVVDSNDHLQITYSDGVIVDAGYIGLGFTPQNIAEKGANNGYAGLDGGGKVWLSQLPSTLIKYVGVWDASTNTPPLTANDITKACKVYNVSVAGTQFGISFSLGDWAIYNENGDIEKSDNSDDVTSVNGQTGNVSLNSNDVPDSNNKRYMTEAERLKLSQIAENANNYTHPDSHPATMIDEDDTHRFVTDEEKTLWNSTIELLNESIATYSVTDLISGVSAEFKVQPLAPSRALSRYAIFLDTQDISGKLSITQAFTTIPITFESDRVSIAFYDERNYNTPGVQPTIITELVKTQNNVFFELGILKVKN